MKVLKQWWVLPLFLLCFVVGKYLYKMPKFNDGERSPNFEWTLPSGEKSDLTKLEGKYVLIDFWGSWCGPCRAEFAPLSELFKKYNNTKFKSANGFDIVGVAVEKKERSMNAVIKKYDFKWQNHVFDKVNSFKFFDSPIAQLYGVKDVPTKYLLDEKGVIVLVNPSVGELDEFLNGQI